MSANPMMDPSDPIALEDARGWAVAGDAETLERNYTTGAMLHTAASAWALISIAESLARIADGPQAAEDASRK